MPKLSMGTGSRVLMCHGGPPLCRGPHDSANDGLELNLRPLQGDPQVISPSVGTTQTAACWVVVTNDGRFAYVTNTGSGSISSYEISFDGDLTLLNAIAAETGPGSGPIDIGLTHDGRFLYVLSSAGGKIDAFRMQAQGGLTRLPGA